MIPAVALVVGMVIGAGATLCACFVALCAFLSSGKVAARFAQRLADKATDEQLYGLGLARLSVFGGRPDQPGHEPPGEGKLYS